jgi:hypothetical protein
MTGRPLIIFDIDSSDQTVDVIVHECVAGIHRAQAVFANMDAETFVTDEEKAYEAARKEEISVELDDNVVQLDVFKAGKENQDGTESDDPEV